jgi:hypothetical protein
MGDRSFTSSPRSSVRQHRRKSEPAPTQRKGTSPSSSPRLHHANSPRPSRSTRRLSLTSPLVPLATDDRSKAAHSKGEPLTPTKLKHSPKKPEGEMPLNGTEKQGAERTPSKLKHVPKKLETVIPSNEIEKLERYLDWAIPVDARDDAERCLNCCLAFGDALHAVAGGTLEKWDELTRSIREGIHAKQKGPNLISPTLQAADYYVWAANSAIKVGAYLALFFKKNPHLTGVALVSTYFTVFPVAIHNVAMFREWLRNLTASWKERERALATARGALRFMVKLEKGKARVAVARDYRAFIAACSRIPEVSPAAVQERRRTTASALRDCLVLPGTVITSMFAQAAVISGQSVVERGRLMLGSGACYLTQGILDITQGWGAEALRCGDLENAAKKGMQHAGQRGIIPAEELDMRAANEVYQEHQQRVVAYQKFEKASGVIRGLKGVCNVGLGIASLANGYLQVHEKDTGITSAVIGTTAAVISMLYMAQSATKQVLRGQASNKSKYRQRQAQMLIAMYPLSDLRRAIEMDATLPLAMPKGQYVEGRGGFETTAVAVRVRENEHLGLHLVATAISSLIDKGEPCDDAAVMVCLREVWKMSELNLQSMFLIAQATAPARRLSFLKSCLGPVFRADFRLQDEARAQERPLKASVVVSLAFKLIEDKQWDTKAKGWKEEWTEVLRNELFDRVGRDEFILAVDKVNSERIVSRGTPENEKFNFLIRAANRARTLRKKEFDSILAMSRRDEKILKSRCALSADEIENFIDLVEAYEKAKILKFDRTRHNGPEAEAKYKKDQAQSALDRIGILGKLAKDPVVAAFLGNPEVPKEMRCGFAISGLLDQLDRHVSLADGRDSDTDSSVDSISGSDDGDDGDSDSSGSEDSPYLGETRKKASDASARPRDSRRTSVAHGTRKRSVKPTQEIDGDDGQNADEVKIPIGSASTDTRRRQQVRTLTTRAKKHEDELLRTEGKKPVNRDAPEANPPDQGVS